MKKIKFQGQLVPKSLVDEINNEIAQKKKEWEEHFEEAINWTLYYGYHPVPLMPVSNPFDHPNVYLNDT
jgi:hypothetical protein